MLVMPAAPTIVAVGVSAREEWRRGQPFACSDVDAVRKGEWAADGVGNAIARVADAIRGDRAHIHGLVEREWREGCRTQQEQRGCAERVCWQLERRKA